MKQRMLSAALMVSEIEFQIDGPATKNALSLNWVPVLGSWYHHEITVVRGERMSHTFVRPTSVTY